MNQSELIYNYNNQFRPHFNDELFSRDENDIIESLKNVILSCERDSFFKIKVLNFEIIENYDDVMHILWAYQDSIINKNRNSDDILEEPDNVLDQKKKSAKKKDNQFECIDLKDSDVKILKVTYFIEINEIKNGLVNDTVIVYIAVPRIVDKFYMRIRGNIYSAMYQIVDASTYNNSASANAKKQSIVFKTIFMPIRIYRYNGNLVTISGEAVPCTYFLGNMFKKTIIVMKYIFAKMGYYNTLRFLKIEGIKIVDDIKQCDDMNYYSFPVGNLFIMIPRFIYDNIPVAQSVVYTIINVLNSIKNLKIKDVYDNNTWIKSLGSEFSSKNMDAIYTKGLSILNSLEFIYDLGTKKDLKLDPEDKDDIYRVLRWIMYEFSSLRLKDNLDITTKKIRYADYIAALYANKLANGIYRLSDKGDKADINTIKKAIKIPPLYLLNQITNCQLVNYNNCVNDLDSTVVLKFTYKGVAGVGEKSNAIPISYRSIHPSHMGRLDLDSSSNSDPGVSGTICPLARVHDNHFSDFKEPSSWESELNKIVQEYKQMTGRKEMIRLLSNTKNINNNDNIINECISINKSLIDFSIKAYDNSEFINGIDLFGDGLLYYLED